MKHQNLPARLKVIQIARLAVCAASLTLAASALPPTAGAAVLRAEYTGHLESGFDAEGLLGSRGVDLSGASFLATLIYDTDVGVHYDNPPGTLVTQGGADVGLPSPFKSVSIKIGGSPLPILFGSNDEVGAEENYLTHYAYKRDDQGTSYLLSISAKTLGTPRSLTWIGSPPIEAIFGQIDIYHYGDGTSATYRTYLTGRVVGGSLTVSPVPDAPVWLVLVGGFGMIGVTLRSRRTALNLMA
ncbi:hypothetical protein [Phenylobacterium sp.]|uniref:hypothetical protein n=1 Tax=Phenylobacterium sp. TaxID=1871053 RepID=UPI003BAA5757